jgi:hypothetical protein
VYREIILTKEEGIHLSQQIILDRVRVFLKFFPVSIFTNAKLSRSQVVDHANAPAKFRRPRLGREYPLNAEQAGNVQNLQHVRRAVMSALPLQLFSSNLKRAVIEFHHEAKYEYSNSISIALYRPHTVNLVPSMTINLVSPRQHPPATP